MYADMMKSSYAYKHLICIKCAFAGVINEKFGQVERNKQNQNKF